ncbi:MAG: ABC transporter ATP-binding protein [Thermomicrobiales bacterium]|nr:ABC transporter ATP-binding protein [Thermomicrobiales bacterium]
MTLTNARDAAGERQPAMLRLSGVTRRFGSTIAVDTADLEVSSGEFVALLGPSGCGKTTTLRLIAGFEQPDAGQIELAGEVISGPTVALPPERRRTGLMFQEYALFPHMSVGKNIGYGVGRGENRAERVAEALALVGLEGFESRMPGELSGGQQQRVALARALATQPLVMLLDEPFSNLDPERRQQIRADLRAILKRAGVTVVMVTHDQEEALSLADRVAVMLEGRIAQVDTPGRLYHAPATRAVAQFIGDAQFVRGTADGLMAKTPLGDVWLLSPAEGEVDVMIRPEMIELHDPEARPELPQGVITALTFYGHDQRATIELPGGGAIDARWISREWHRFGERVALQLHSPAQAFTDPA